jgi:hypothetical protein
MISRIINFAKTIGSKLPVIKNLLSPPNKTPETVDLRLNHIPIKESKEILSIDSNQNLAIKSIRELLKGSESKHVLNKKFPDFSKSIGIFVNKIGPHLPIEFKEKNLKDLMFKYQNELNRGFEGELNKLNNEVFDEKNHIKYVELFNDFILENKRLMKESADQIIINTSEIQDANDLDLINALKTSREINKELAKNTLNIVNEKLNNIPIGYEVVIDKNKKNLRELIKSEFQEEYTNLYLKSNFGYHSSEVIHKIFEILEKNNKKTGKDLYENLIVVKKLQEAIHGSLIQSRNVFDSNEYEIGMINPRILKGCYERLIELHFQYIDLRSKIIKKEDYDRKKLEIIGEINDLKEFIYDLGLIENSTTIELKNVNQEPLWIILNINPNEVSNKINESYKKTIWLEKYLGSMKGENILGFEFSGTHVINLLNINREEKVDQLKRLIYEVSTLAAIQVVLEEHFQEKNIDFSKIRNNDTNVLEATRNFETIPWLKNFYKERVEYYKNLVNKLNTELRVAPVIKEISKMGKELNKGGLFTTSSFFERYGITKEGEKLKSIMGDMTSVGRMSLNIEFITNFMSYLLPDPKSSISNEDMAKIKSLINFLSTESKILDEHGNENFIGHKTSDQNVIKNYNRLKKLIGSKSFLSLNMPLILNFLRKTYGKDPNSDFKVEKNSFEEKNQVLSAWLFYVILKFLPSESNDDESLKARIEIIKPLMDDNFQSEFKVTDSLFKKMIKQARGLSEEGNIPSKQGRKGTIKSLCTDLERHIEKHISGKDPSPIEISKLLRYYAEVENIFKENPKSHQIIKDVQKNIFKNPNELLKPLENSLINIYRRYPNKVIEFIIEQKENNPHYYSKFCMDLISQIDSELKTLPIKNGKIEIKDSDEKNIRKFIRIIMDLKNLGLVNKLPNQDISVLRFDLLSKNRETQESLNKIIDSIKKALELEVDLIIDNKYLPEEESFKNQYALKNELVKLLRSSKIGFKPHKNLNFNWESNKELVA